MQLRARWDTARNPGQKSRWCEVKEWVGGLRWGKGRPGCSWTDGQESHCRVRERQLRQRRGGGSKWLTKKSTQLLNQRKWKTNAQSPRRQKPHTCLSDKRTSRELWSVVLSAGAAPCWQLGEQQPRARRVAFQHSGLSSCSAEPYGAGTGHQVSIFNKLNCSTWIKEHMNFTKEWTVNKIPKQIHKDPW